MSVKLSGTLPKPSDRNGMEVLHTMLLGDPERTHVVVMVVDNLRTTTEHTGDGPIHTPTAGVLMIEPILDDEDVQAVMEIMVRARAERTGNATLDFGDDAPPSNVSDFLKHGRGVFVGDEGGES